MGEEDSVDVDVDDDDASLPKLLLNENASDGADGADGADAGASAGAGAEYDITVNVFGTNANIF
jgi:hypothetical protein